MSEKFKPKKFDIVTPDDTVIHGALYTEKPSFNYSEVLAKKNKPEEIKKLKSLRDDLCTSIRINKVDINVDDKKLRLLTSRRIVVRYQNEFKKKNLIPAIVEDTASLDSVEVQVEYL